MSTSQATGSSVQEYVIRVPKNVKKKYQVMRFNSSVNVDFGKWTQVKMERENNMKEFKGFDEDQPKFGAGSEFGRDAREEARRKKYGIVSRKYRPDDQPWILKAGGKTGKKFRGIREGGVAENAAYYVFTHAPDGAIDAFPLQEWYNFQPIQRYKALSAEEAEQEFGRRNKHLNFFSLMLRKRLRGEDDGEVEDPEEMKGKKGGAKKKELKISEMDDWIDSDDESDSESEEEKEKKEEKEEKKEKEKKTKKGETGKKKKKKKDSDDEAFEESDDGDEEGREVDYISDSSDSDSDHEGKVNKQMQGVAEEESLRKLLSSGEEDDDDQEKQDGDKDSETEEKEKSKVEGDKVGDKDKKSTASSSSSGSKKLKKKKKQLDAAKKIKKEATKVAKESSSDFSSDSTDSETEAKKKGSKDGTKGSKESNSGGSSRSATPTKDVSGDGKRKASSTPESSTSKKARLDNFASATLAPYAGDSGITEDAVRRYLMRKPMTTTELLQKFKSKKTGLSSDQLVNIMTQILKRINPVKQTIKCKMYLSIKA